jgi:hypothetical protein
MMSERAYLSVQGVRHPELPMQSIVANVLVLLLVSYRLSASESLLV